MEGEKRREKIVEILKQSQVPVSGTKLSKILGISRQVVVQDIALLRAENEEIIATTKGYLILKKEKEKARRRFEVYHTQEQIEEELCSIVDLGGEVKNVIVVHKVYGEITVELIVKNRQDVKEFLKKIAEEGEIPLMKIANGVHIHTVEADSEQILDQIEQTLKEKGFMQH